MFRLRILDAAVQDLAALDKPVATQVAKRLRWLAQNFEQIEPQPLYGELAGLYKLRAGDYRIFYEILRDEELLIIHVIGHRREVYRKR